MQWVEVHIIHDAPWANHEDVTMDCATNDAVLRAHLRRSSNGGSSRLSVIRVVTWLGAYIEKVAHRVCSPHQPSRVCPAVHHTDSNTAVTYWAIRAEAQPSRIRLSVA